MDLFIMVNLTEGFLLFFILHLLVFRIMSADRVFQGLVLVFVLADIITAIMGVALNPFVFHLGLIYLVVGLLISTFLYFLLSLFYILAFFGISVTSLRINILSLINKGTGGMSYREILRVYNKNTIIETRLKRLVGSGELRVSKGKYKSESRFSYFVFHTYLFIFLSKLYQGKLKITDNKADL